MLWRKLWTRTSFMTLTLMNRPLVSSWHTTNWSRMSDWNVSRLLPWSLDTTSMNQTDLGLWRGDETTNAPLSNHHCQQACITVTWVYFSEGSYKASGLHKFNWHGKTNCIIKIRGTKIIRQSSQSCSFHLHYSTAWQCTLTLDHILYAITLNLGPSSQTG